jgi:hypothetical protein
VNPNKGEGISDFRTFALDSSIGTKAMFVGAVCQESANRAKHRDMNITQYPYLAGYNSTRPRLSRNHRIMTVFSVCIKISVR